LVVTRFKVRPLQLNWYWLWPVIGLLVALIGYLALNSGIGQGIFIEQELGSVTTLLIVMLFILKPFKIGFFEILGVYSYEIYLLHWPILYHYDLLYKLIPASLATIAYLGVFIGLGMGSQKLQRRFF